MRFCPIFCGTAGGRLFPFCIGGGGGGRTDVGGEGIREPENIKNLVLHKVVQLQKKDNRKLMQAAI